MWGLGDLKKVFSVGDRSTQFEICFFRSPSPHFFTLPLNPGSKLLLTAQIPYPLLSGIVPSSVQELGDVINILPSILWNFLFRLQLQ